MWKYIKLIPLIIYPYLYLLLPVSIIVLSDPEMNSSDAVMSILGFFGSIAEALNAVAPNLFNIVFISFIILLNILPMVIAIFNAVYSSKGKYSARQAAKINVIVKGFHIPIYLFNFVIAVLGIFMSVWGVGIVAIAIVVDFLTIILTGINALGCPIRLYKDSVISKSRAIILGICSFIYCIDVAVAIYYMILTQNDPKTTNITVDNTELNVV